LRLSENFICKTWAAWAQLEILVQADLKYNNYILVATKLIYKVKIGWVSDCAFYLFKNTWFAFLWRCIQPNCMVPFEHHKFATINIISRKFAAKIREKQWRVVSKFEES
jgi:hypothetical protein